MFGSSSKVLNVGVIGLGIIGSRVAECLSRADHPVFVWSRTTRPVPNFLASPHEVAEVAQIIQIFVRDAEALLEVMRDMQPVLGKHHIVLCHATVSVDAVKQAAAIAADAGAGFLDAPFTGSKMAAEKGELIYYIGGDEAKLEIVRKALEASSKKIMHFGDVGTATVLKIATNLISAAVVEAVAEALAITKSQGIAPEKLLEALVPNANCSPLITMKLPAMISGSHEPHFSLKNMLKDARYAQALAKEKELPTPVLDATAKAMDKAVKAGHAEQDYAVVMTNFTAKKATEKPTKGKAPAVAQTPPEPVTLKASAFAEVTTAEETPLTPS
jgi:3-hydroxyisobutyrate dehydrogenase-like beta-hydroxyacid dehydrogenase